MSRVWFITGANRGFGYEIVKTALATGDTVVATSRRLEDLHNALGSDRENLLQLRLDVTSSESIDDAVADAIAAFGRLDVVVNNAGYGQLGAFEELSPSQVKRQFATNVFGVFDVTRAVLPTLRAQRAGHIINIASIAGITGGAGSTIYNASKFAVTGWSEGLAEELAPLGIMVTVVHPGMFSTDFLDPSSVRHGDIQIDDYRESSDAHRDWLDRMNHAQLGDPKKFGPFIVDLANQAHPPARLGAGSDAIAAFRTRATQLLSNLDEYEAVTRSTDHVR